jgi:hypothetical protein
MLESSRKQGWRVGLVGWTVIASTLSVGTSTTWAAPKETPESLPASVRACATHTDPEQRLACYDREVASFPEPTAKAAAKPAPAPAVAAAKSTPTPASAPSGSAPPPQSSSESASGRSAAAVAETAKDTGRVSARIVTIDRQPNEMVLHLDNGQVWQQIQGVSGDLSLREGDTVKIEKHLGSYWLSGPHVTSMRVRQIS